MLNARYPSDARMNSALRPIDPSSTTTRMHVDNIEHQSSRPKDSQPPRRPTKVFPSPDPPLLSPETSAVPSLQTSRKNSSSSTASLPQQTEPVHVQLPRTSSVLPSTMIQPNYGVTIPTVMVARRQSAPNMKPANSQTDSDSEEQQESVPPKQAPSHQHRHRQHQRHQRRGMMMPQPPYPYTHYGQAPYPTGHPIPRPSHYYPSSKRPVPVQIPQPHLMPPRQAHPGAITRLPYHPPPTMFYPYMMHPSIPPRPLPHHPHPYAHFYQHLLPHPPMPPMPQRYAYYHPYMRPTSKSSSRHSKSKTQPPPPPPPPPLPQQLQQHQQQEQHQKPKRHSKQQQHQHQLQVSTVIASEVTNQPSRRRLTKQDEREVLERFYAANPRPTREERIKLAEELGWDHQKTVRVWFQNRRFSDASADGGCIPLWRRNSIGGDAMKIEMTGDMNLDAYQLQQAKPEEAVASAVVGNKPSAAVPVPSTTAEPTVVVVTTTTGESSMEPLVDSVSASSSHEQSCGGEHDLEPEEEVEQQKIAPVSVVPVAVAVEVEVEEQVQIETKPEPEPMVVCPPKMEQLVEPAQPEPVFEQLVEPAQPEPVFEPTQPEPQQVLAQPEPIVEQAQPEPRQELAQPETVLQATEPEPVFEPPQPAPQEDLDLEQALELEQELELVFETQSQSQQYFQRQPEPSVEPEQLPIFDPAVTFEQREQPEPQLVAITAPVPEPSQQSLEVEPMVVDKEEGELDEEPVHRSSAPSPDLGGICVEATQQSCFQTDVGQNTTSLFDELALFDGFADAKAPYIDQNMVIANVIASMPPPIPMQTLSVDTSSAAPSKDKGKSGKAKSEKKKGKKKVASKRASKLNPRDISSAANLAQVAAVLSGHNNASMIPNSLQNLQFPLHTTLDGSMITAASLQPLASSSQPATTLFEIAPISNNTPSRASGNKTTTMNPLAIHSPTHNNNQTNNGNNLMANFAALQPTPGLGLVDTSSLLQSALYLNGNVGAGAGISIDNNANNNGSNNLNGNVDNNIALMSPSGWMNYFGLDNMLSPSADPNSFMFNGDYGLGSMSLGIGAMNMNMNMNALGLGNGVNMNMNAGNLNMMNLMNNE